MITFKQLGVGQHFTFVPLTPDYYLDPNIYTKTGEREYTVAGWESITNVPYPINNMNSIVKHIDSERYTVGLARTEGE